MNISGVPLLAEPSNLPASSTLPETDWENIPVHENDVTTVLMQRWIACYMLYDWNLHHADYAYLSNKEMPPNNLRKPVAKFTDFIRFTLNKMRRLFSGSS